MAQREDILTQPPATLLLLCYYLGRAPRPAGAPLNAGLSQQEQLLRQAQLRYPTDLWINHALGRHLLLTMRSAEAIGFFRAALAVQPRNADLDHLLGICLRSDR